LAARRPGCGGHALLQIGKACKQEWILLAQGADQRRWVQRSVLMLDLAAVALMGVLNWSWARA